jgi:hypothetical protein
MRADKSFSKIGIHAIVFPSAGFGAVSAREAPGDEEKEECIWAIGLLKTLRIQPEVKGAGFPYLNRP